MEGASFVSVRGIGLHVGVGYQRPIDKDLQLAATAAVGAAHATPAVAGAAIILGAVLDGTEWSTPHGKLPRPHLSSTLEDMQEWHACHETRRRLVVAWQCGGDRHSVSSPVCREGPALKLLCTLPKSFDAALNLWKVGLRALFFGVAFFLAICTLPGAIWSAPVEVRPCESASVSPTSKVSSAPIEMVLSLFPRGVADQLPSFMSGFASSLDTIEEGDSRDPVLRRWLFISPVSTCPSPALGLERERDRRPTLLPRFLPRASSGAVDVRGPSASELSSESSSSCSGMTTASRATETRDPVLFRALPWSPESPSPSSSALKDDRDDRDRDCRPTLLLRFLGLSVSSCPSFASVDCAADFRATAVED